LRRLAEEAGTSSDRRYAFYMVLITTWWWSEDRPGMPGTWPDRG